MRTGREGHSQLVQISARLLSGQEVDVEASSHDTVAGLQKLIATQLGVWPLQVQLYVDTAPLQIQQRLEELQAADITIMVLAAPLWIYACGGEQEVEVAHARVRAFNAVTGEALSLPPMACRRGYTGVAMLGPHLYVFGGCCGKNGHQVLSSGERLDVTSTSQNWEVLTPMPQPRSAGTLVAAGGRLYYCGGSRRCKTFQSVVIYDPATGSWQEGPSMMSRRTGAAAVLHQDRIYMFGGNDGLDALSSAEYLDLDKTRWMALPRMRKRRVGAMCAAVGGHIYVCGGGNGVDALASVERFCLTSWQWERVQPMLGGRSHGLAFEMQGCLMVCGGKDHMEIDPASRETGQLSTRIARLPDYMERFCPQANCWEKVLPWPAASFASAWAGAVAGGEAPNVRSLGLLS